MNRAHVTHRLRPASVLFADFYFYLNTSKAKDDRNHPVYFRVDRIKCVIDHSRQFADVKASQFDWGMLWNRRLFV